MTRRLHGNNVTRVLASTINASDTTITLDATTGIPSIGTGEVVYVTVQQGTKREIMIITDDASAPDYIVTRAAESTTARNFASGASVQIRLTKDSVDRKADMVGTAGDVIDWGAIDSFELPNSAAPTVNAAGEIALDTTITDHQPLIKYYSGTAEMCVIAVPTAQLTTTDNQVLEYDAANDRFQFVTPAAGVSDGDYGEVVVSGSGAVWTLDNNLTFHGTDGNTIAQGSTASRPAAGTFGRIRGNTSTGFLELDDGSAWNPLPKAPNGTITALSIPTWSATNTPNLINNSGATISSGIITCSGITFGNETLSDYDEGTWTPSMTFATPGDLSLGSVTATGYYTKKGREVTIHFRYSFTPTHTTASGNFRLTGLPFTVSANLTVVTSIGSISTSTNVSYPAGLTYCSINPIASQTYCQIIANGSSTANANLTTTNFATGLTYTLTGTVVYFI